MCGLWDKQALISAGHSSEWLQVKTEPATVTTYVYRKLIV